MMAGKLTERIVIAYKLRKENELGEVEECSYFPKYETKAQVIYKSGNRVDDYSIQTEYTVQFVIRYYHNVAETDRVMYNGDYYRIDSIERNRQYQLQKLNCTMIHE